MFSTYAAFFNPNGNSNNPTGLIAEDSPAACICTICIP